MLRNVLGVIGGYIAMFIAVFVTFTALYLAIGADRAFKPESFEPSMLWTVASIVVSIAAAVIGGLVCGLISKSRGAVISLAVVVVVLGLAMAIPALFGVAPADLGPRSGDLSNLEAMQQARPPVWTLIVNPIIGAVGAIIGGFMVTKPKVGGGSAVDAPPAA
ncbi:MAG: hypothetical protein VYC34_00115 [Planctomycetota bacterium]|nr:hypothetical protein [Planctomycetota bacterium]